MACFHVGYPKGVIEVVWSLGLGDTLPLKVYLLQKLLTLM